MNIDHEGDGGAWVIVMVVGLAVLALMTAALVGLYWFRGAL